MAESIHKNIHPRIPVQTILNGVDTDRFKRNSTEGESIRKQYNIPSNAIVIGNIAVFRFQKRLKEWVDLFKTVADKNEQLYGCIIGDGPLNLEIRNHVKSLGLENRIIMPGLQTNVLPWLSAIDIFLMTSEFEGLPIALLEAMSMQCAVVCTDAGGIKEVIRNNEDGFLVPVSDWQSAAEPISKLISNPAEIINWGTKARNRVKSAFSLAAMVEQTEKLYVSVLQ